MKSRSICWLVAIALTYCTFSVRSAYADPVKYTIVEIPTIGGTENFAYAINDRGDVVGLSRKAGDSFNGAFLFGSGLLTSLDRLNGSVPQDINKRGQIATGVYSNGVYVPALYDSRTGQITVLGSFGGVFGGVFNGEAFSVNNRGQVVGYSYLDSLNRHAFLYSDGVMTDLGSFGGYSAALAINFSGEIAGFSSETVNGYSHAFVFREGVMTEINPFGGPNNESIARGINDRGHVVGEGLVATGGAFNGFIYFDGAITNIGTLDGGRNSYAFAINDHRQVVGIADQPYEDLCWDFTAGRYVPCINYAQRAFLYEDGVMTDLNSLIAPDSGWDLSWAFDINDRGQITGYGLRNGKFRAYLMTPNTLIDTDIGLAEKAGRGRKH
jgi:probable HAF family extracellular repeat protein